MSAWNKFDVFIVILSCAEAIASLVIGQYVNDEINKMEGNTTSSLKILKLFKGMDLIKVTYCMHTVCMYNPYSIGDTLTFLWPSPAIF